MNSVYSILKELEADNSKLGKIAILTREIDNSILKRFFEISLNPYINFWQKKIPEYINVGDDGDLLEEMEDLLEVLSKRKLTGNAAVARLSQVLCSVSDENADVLIRMIKKDPKCGVSESTINKVWKDLVPTYPCLLASAYDQKLMENLNWKKKVYSQAKKDGLRVNIVISDEGIVQLFTRSGREMDVLGRFDSLGKMYPGQVFDGELLTINPETLKFNNRQTSNGICSKAVKGTLSQEEANQLHAVVWDIIRLDHFKAKKSNILYGIRFSNLETIFETNETPELLSLVESRLVSSPEEAQEHYLELRAKGEEGSIVKSEELPWEDKRSKLQIKMKAIETCSLKVVGANEGKNILEGNLGALLMESEDGIVKVKMSGFSLKVRSEIWANLTKKDVSYQVMTKQGWEERIAKPGDLEVDIGTIVDLLYNEKTMDKNGGWSLFLPRFDSVRFDKTEADLFDHIK